MIKIFFIFALLACCAQLNYSVLGAVEDLAGESCFRKCDSASRVCYFHWHLERYHVLGPACGSCGRPDGNINDCFNDQCITADGVERGVMSINRKIPGPSIHVCRNDIIVVDVSNQMGGTSASIHWHGFHMRATPYMDGVPFITQCPIDFATTFRYVFKATEPGTQFYHSHAGHHKVNGHYGGIVVRRPTGEDPNEKTYDQDLREHLVIVSDWMEHDGEMFMPGLRSKATAATSLLINGKGTLFDRQSGNSTTRTPLEVFHVKKGQRYRFRVVNSMSHICPASLEIENHSLLVIASDSFDVHPTVVDAVISLPGERYDFVVHANQTEGTYWIRLRSVGPCEARQLEQFAILNYLPVDSKAEANLLAFPQERIPQFAQTFGEGRTLNHPSTKCLPGNTKTLCINDLSSADARRPDITDVVTPDYRLYLGFDSLQKTSSEIFGSDNYDHFVSRGNDVFVGVINNISFVSPPFPLLTQREQITESMFCDKNSRPKHCVGKATCHCTHRIKIKLNSIVELIVIDERAAISTLNHPFHLHGFQLFVMDMGQYPDRPMTVELFKRIARLLPPRNSTKSYVVKDTISIPSKGYTIFRFKADNPGFWLMHCHFEWHMAVGMGLVLQVGELNQMVRPPKNFPKCNNFKPVVKDIFRNARDLSLDDIFDLEQEIPIF